MTEASATTTPPKCSCIVVLIGLPGSGKTTFAQVFSDEVGKDRPVRTVSFDQVLPLEKQKVLATGAVASGDREWKLARLDMKDKVRQMFEGASADGVIGLVDDNNYYRSMRYEYYQLARDLNVGFCQIYLQVGDITTALASNSSRPPDTRVPDEVVRQMSSKLERPHPLANPWESFSFVVDVEAWRADMRLLLPTVRSVVEAAAASPVTAAPVPQNRTEEARAASRLATNKSLLHKVDKRLRKVVGERIAAALESSDNDDHDDAATTSVGMDMVKVRTDLLKDLKSGGSSDFSLPEDLAQRLQEGPASDSDLAELDTVLNKMFDMKIGK